MFACLKATFKKEFMAWKFINVPHNTVYIYILFIYMYVFLSWHFNHLCFTQFVLYPRMALPWSTIWCAMWKSGRISYTICPVAGKADEWTFAVHQRKVSRGYHGYGTTDPTDSRGKRGVGWVCVWYCLIIVRVIKDLWSMWKPRRPWYRWGCHVV